MKINEKLNSAALVSVVLVLFLIFISSTALAQTEPEITNGVGDASDEQVLPNEIPTEENNIATESIQATAPKIIETRITTSGSARNPIIYGNKIAWEDSRNGKSDIYVYDLSTKKEAKITTSGLAEDPDIYGNRIVYSDNGGLQICMYDLSTKKVTQITADRYAEEPDIYNNRIVWAGNGGIYMYDLSTKKETLIASGELGRYSPDIYGDRIVWTDMRNEGWNIYMYDLSTKKETPITNGWWASNPAIYGNIIVWQDDRNGNGDIYMYNLSTKKETQITPSPEYQASPAIYGNMMVWMDYHNEYRDICVYNLATHQESYTTAKSDQTNPKIYGDRIVWEDYRNGYDNPDIYMGTLVYSPIAAFSASLTSGKATLSVKFTDKSSGSPTKWKWSFGDGKTSTTKNPTHKYSKVGSYTVKLTVTNAAGSSTATKTNYIKVITNTRPGIYSENKKEVI